MKKYPRVKITSKPIQKGRAAKIKKSAMSSEQKKGKMYDRVNPKKLKNIY